MTRFRSFGVAVVALALSAGAVAAFNTLPDAASTGLDRATGASGQTVPARPDALPAPADDQGNVNAQDLPDAASHGVDVSTVARADDPTPDTNHGADVSAVAKDNHGQSIAAEHRPTDAGAPDGAGKPEGAGKPDQPGRPDNPGPPDGAGKP